MPVLNLLSEFLVVLAILGLILWIEPVGTIFLGLALSVIAISFYRATNKLVGSWGKDRLKAEEQKIKISAARIWWNKRNHSFGKYSSFCF